MDLLDGSGLWSITTGPADPTPPPPPAAAVIQGHGVVIESRSYFDALRYWLRYGRKGRARTEAEAALLADARRRDEIEREDDELMGLL